MPHDNVNTKPCLTQEFAGGLSCQTNKNYWLRRATQGVCVVCVALTVSGTQALKWCVQWKLNWSWCAILRELWAVRWSAVAVYRFDLMFLQWCHYVLSNNHNIQACHEVSRIKKVIITRTSVNAAQTAWESSGSASTQLPRRCTLFFLTLYNNG